MFINVSRSGKFITGSVNGEPFGISFSQERYDLMKELEKKANSCSKMDELNVIFEEFKPLTIETYKELAETICPYIFVNNSTGKFYLQLHGVVLKDPLPQALVDRILKSIEDGIEFLPLVKAWIRFLRNPNYSVAKGKLFANYINRTYTDHSRSSALQAEKGLSAEVAKGLATSYQTPITAEGFLVTYKVSTELTEKWIIDGEGNKKQVPRYAPTIDENSGIVSYDTPKFVEDRVFEPAIMHQRGDEFWCVDLKGVGNKGHIIKVGHRLYLDNWSQVNTTDGVTGSEGLHAGNLDYIKGYQRADTVTHNVFIDPAMIGRFTDQGDGAVVAKDMFIYGSFAGPNRSIYHSSEYGKLTDKEYEDLLAASIVDHGTKAKDLEASKEQAKVIGNLDLEGTRGTIIVDKK